MYLQLDLGSLQSVRSFADTFLKTEPRLDLLINNAGESSTPLPFPHLLGVLPVSFTHKCFRRGSGLVADGRTKDGFGVEFGVNHLGHFLLTCLLLERLKEGAGGRVITLSSLAHRWGRVDFDELLATKDLGSGRYSWQFFQAYCNSKLCNVLFTRELARRLHGTTVSCYSVHPGA